MDTNNLSLLPTDNRQTEVQWRIAPVDATQADTLANALNVSAGVAGLYLRLGLDTTEKVQAFNCPDADALHSHWLLPDMKAAAERLHRALENGETIHVHGDYDADGITATALAVYALRRLGANVTYHIPHRLHDGYGLHVEAVERAKQNNAAVLLSVDCGTDAHEAADACREMGIDLIVTDHHEPEPDAPLPPCVAIVNPNRADSVYPFRALSGVGVAFKTMLALCERRGLSLTNVRNRLLEFVALGTVVDMAPLVDENRVLVQLGLEQLRKTAKLGLRALLQTSGVLDTSLLSSATIGYQLGPRLNAPGRVDDPHYALDVLLAQEETLARQGATRLEGFNRQRKILQAQFQAEALALLSGDAAQPGMGILQDGIVVVACAEWQPGLLGPLASELAGQFNRPALAARIGADGTAMGSCRSPRDTPILHALKSPECKALLTRCGGHAFAAGFALPAENLPLLAERLDAWVVAYRREQALQAGKEGQTIAPPTLDFDGEFGAGDVSLDTLRALAQMAPLREDRTEPLLLLRNLRVVRAQSVKKGEHLKLTLRDDDSNTLTAMAWGRGADAGKYPTSSRLDIAARLACDTRDGLLSAQLHAQEIRFSDQHEVVSG